MTEIHFHIKLPDVSLPRRAVVVLGLGVVVGVMGALVAVDLSQGYKSRIIQTVETVAGPLEDLPPLSVLTEEHKASFKDALAEKKVPSDTSYQVRLVYEGGCQTCRDNASGISKIINGTAGWRVASMSGREGAGKVPGLVIEVGAKSVSSPVLAALRSALPKARIGFSIEETDVDDKGVLTLFFGRVAAEPKAQPQAKTKTKTKTKTQAQPQTQPE